ncbi:MAG: hypothetical protein R2770_00840 [Acidimicrobiales bacterium]
MATPSRIDALDGGQDQDSQSGPAGGGASGHRETRRHSWGSQTTAGATDPIALAVELANEVDVAARHDQLHGDLLERFRTEALDCVLALARIR